MKKSLTKFVFIISLLSGFLTGCKEGAGNFSFLNGDKGGWGYDDLDYYDDDDDWDDYEDDDEDEKEDSKKNSSSSENKNNSSSSSRNNSQQSQSNNNNNNSGAPNNSDVADRNNPYFEFKWQPSDQTCSARFISGASMSEVSLPATYVYEGVNYKVIDDDYAPGFSYKMDVTSITLPEGFKELHMGFAHDINLVKVMFPSTMRKVSASLFVGCTAFKTLEYNGTTSEWNDIIKDEDWLYRCPAFTVVCKNGSFDIPAYVEPED